MNIFNVWIPISLTHGIPPWSPGNCCIKACNKFIGFPYFTKGLLNFWICPDHPGCMVMASSITYKEPHLISSRPILIKPCWWIVSFQTTSQRFKPLPKGIFSFGDFILRKNVLQNNTSVSKQWFIPFVKLFQLKMLNLCWTHLIFHVNCIIVNTIYENSLINKDSCKFIWHLSLFYLIRVTKNR